MEQDINLEDDPLYYHKLEIINKAPQKLNTQQKAGVDKLLNEAFQQGVSETDTILKGSGFGHSAEKDLAELLDGCDEETLNSLSKGALPVANAVNTLYDKYFEKEAHIVSPEIVEKLDLSKIGQELFVMTQQLRTEGAIKQLTAWVRQALMRLADSVIKQQPFHNPVRLGEPNFV
jgi:hypothetical protein